MKAFISYSTADKKYGSAVKSVFTDLKIYSFLAHEDLAVSVEWQREILKQLKACDLFVPLLSKAFKESNWCAQETGIASVKKSVLILPISIDGTVPYGFISHIQAHKIASPELEKSVIIDAIGKRSPEKAIEILLPPVAKAQSYRGAESLIAPLVPYFGYFSSEQANELAGYAVSNGQIWSASLCASDYLPRFMELNKPKIKQRLYRALKYQVEHQKVYEGRKRSK